jgi:hypothetical protein
VRTDRADRFYGLVNESQGVREELRRRLMQDPQAALQWLEQTPHKRALSQSAGGLQKISEHLGGLRRQAEMVRLDPALTPEQRQQTLQQLQREEQMLLLLFSEADVKAQGLQP